MSDSSTQYSALRLRPGQRLEVGQENKVYFTKEMKIDFCKRICALYATGKYTLEQCCKHYGISTGKFRTWTMPHLDVEQLLLDGEDLPKNLIMECREMYAEAKSKAMFNYKDNLADAARKGLLKRAEGYETEEYTEERIVDSKATLDDGEPNPNFGKLITVKQKVKRFTVAPDTSALIFAAVNTMPETFKHRNQLEHSGNVNLSATGLESLTDTQLKEKREELEFRNRKLQEARRKTA